MRHQIPDELIQLGKKALAIEYTPWNIGINASGEHSITTDADPTGLPGGYCATFTGDLTVLSQKSPIERLDDPYYGGLDQDNGITNEATCISSGHVWMLDAEEERNAWMDPVSNAGYLKANNPGRPGNCPCPDIIEYDDFGNVVDNIDITTAAGQTKLHEMGVIDPARAMSEGFGRFHKDTKLTDFIDHEGNQVDVYKRRKQLENQEQ